MFTRIEKTLGILFIVGIVVGVVVPIYSTIHGVGVGGTKIRVSIKDVLSWIRGFTHLGIELVYNKTIDIEEPIDIELKTMASTIHIEETNRSTVNIKIYKSTLGFDIDHGRYSVEYDRDRGLLKIDVNGYIVDIEIPRNAVKTLILNAISSSVAIELSSDILRSVIVNAKSSSVSLGFKEMNEANLSIDAVSSSIDIGVGFHSYEGSTNISIDSLNSYINMNLKIDRDTKIAIKKIDSLNSYVGIDLNKQRVHSGFVDRGYEEAKSRLCIDVSAENSAIDVDIQRE